MKTFRANSGPFQERPYYELQEIENICADELRKAGLYPSNPSPIRIDRFIEKRFQIVPIYDSLSPNLLGYTKFGPRGVEEIVVSRALAEDGNKVAERQMNSTLAHEAGHGLLHAYLFALEPVRYRSLFGVDLDPKTPKILCRGEVAESGGRGKRPYDGKWWEFQANQAIGAMLLPRALVADCLDSFLTRKGKFGVGILPSERRSEAVRRLSETFDVNPAVARIRLEDVFGEGDSSQLTL